MLLRILAITLLLSTQGCGGSPLKPWHTERLREEFSASKAESVLTFADYLELEDRLYAELDEKVYAQVESGPDYELFRYSAGSAADPRNDEPDWNRTFELTTVIRLAACCCCTACRIRPTACASLRGHSTKKATR